MKEKYILLINEDKTWALLEESSIAGIQDDGKDFALFHINSRTSGGKIANIMQELFSEEDCMLMPLTGMFSGLSLQESFVNFLKMKKEESDD